VEGNEDEEVKESCHKLVVVVHLTMRRGDESAKEGTARDVGLPVVVVTAAVAAAAGAVAKL
jgi:hypothetical protein